MYAEFIIFKRISLISVVDISNSLNIHKRITYNIYILHKKNSCVNINTFIILAYYFKSK